MCILVAFTRGRNRFLLQIRRREIDRSHSQGFLSLVVKRRDQKRIENEKWNEKDIRGANNRNGIRREAKVAIGAIIFLNT